MKTLILVGNPEGKYGKEHQHDLARIWVENGHVHVRELGEQYKEFAHEVQRQLDERLANPKTPIYTFSGISRTKKDSTVIHSTVIKSSTPGASDFLEVLRTDRILWDGPGRSAIAGYEVHTGASYILED